MNTWQDAEGREWTIKLTLDLLDRVKAATKIDLAPESNDFSPITRLLFASRKLGEILWQCNGQGIAREAFFAALDGDALAAGWRALVDAIAEFVAGNDATLREAINAQINAHIRLVTLGAEEIIATLKSDDTNKLMQKAADKLGAEMQAELIKELTK